MSLTETRFCFEALVLKKFPILNPFYLNSILEDDFLKIVIPSPGDKNNNCSIYIYANEIIVYFSFWHEHYSLEDSNLQLLIKDLDSIFLEKVAVCNYVCKNNPPIKEGVFYSTLVNIENLPRKNKEYFYVTEIQYISWLGSYNDRFESPYEK